MKQVMNSVKKKAIEKERKAVLKLEMDYELAVLFEAMGENNESKKRESKERLERIRQELLTLKAL
ncbi:hypothetical protein [Niallia endozanthoxylica]|uniref:Uncharacterized protein n=1 Tax=Niallia endozanthoxylica TaxID=2036016 RepID=A0A5J5HU04_9BACI|nr:hypothetical protein [Niallia endozanthoxylica]KAA9026019.1 hypothetical protein F4V44_09055 [Niallia endozanthoxylica]